MSHTAAASDILSSAAQTPITLPENPRTRTEFTLHAAWHAIELDAAEASGDDDRRTRALAAAHLYAHHASLLGDSRATRLLKQLPRR
ncbi:MAG TPA: hypothetical protein ENK18_19730 [Deltaproteobacteria bacterium]|nr:hypothetical protein [Deltaproteobacteria bacterium]